jgi:hypothetical protein
MTLSLPFCIGYGKQRESQVAWVLNKTLEFAGTDDGHRYTENVSRYAGYHLQMKFLAKHCKASYTDNSYLTSKLQSLVY